MTDYGIKAEPIVIDTKPVPIHRQIIRALGKAWGRVSLAGSVVFHRRFR